MTDEAIRFQAQIFKIQTLIDGGMRLTLDLEPDAKTIVALFDAKHPGIVLEVAAVPIIVKQSENNAIPERPERKSKWTPAKGKSSNRDTASGGQ